jgi:hypothetical protein
VLELSRLLDVLLVAVHPLFLVRVPLASASNFSRSGPLEWGGLGELRLDEELVGAVEMLADDLGLVVRPLVGRELLREQHLLHGVVAPERRGWPG